MTSRKAVILMSGGLDSTTCLAIARSQGFSCYAISFDYGQRHRAELIAVKNIVNVMDVEEHKIFQIPIDGFGGSALTNAESEIPDFTGAETIPVTYVPARNTIFLSIALGWAEVLGAHDIFIGVSSVDYSGYPDCRPEYIAAFQRLANLATKIGVEGKEFHIHAPLSHLSKAETIKLGISLGVDYGLTVSCYRADDAGMACGRCDSCALRQKGFADAGVADPTLYVN